ncbi:hypothetical protein FKP32DRAFT_1578154 [Trametes sanguinea]|nr:hypothetical protein FKP32DRAFT_1578154 [Trametes sanguinea]
MKALHGSCRGFSVVSTTERRLACQTLPYCRRLQLSRRFHQSQPLRTTSTSTQPEYLRPTTRRKLSEESPSNYVQPSIRTLRADALSAEDHVVFPVDQEYCFVWDALADQKPSSFPISTSSADHKRPFARIRYSDTTTYFPAGLKGFFYYYTYRNGAPPASGELRFRKTFSSDPTTFSSGKDLEAAHGLPWRIQLPTLATYYQYEIICRILLRDGLVDEPTLRIARQMGNAREKRTEQIPIIHSFRQAFYLDFASPLHWWHIMGPEEIHFTRPMANVLAPKINGQRFPSPWLGGAICAFAPSKSPLHVGHRVLNILVLSIVDPPEPNPQFPREIIPDIIRTQPRVGDMIRRGGSPWALDVDNCEPWRAEGFRTLFENAQLPPPRTGRLLGPRKS